MLVPLGFSTTLDIPEVGPKIPPQVCTHLCDPLFGWEGPLNAGGWIGTPLTRVSAISCCVLYIVPHVSAQERI